MSISRFSFSTGVILFARRADSRSNANNLEALFRIICCVTGHPLTICAAVIMHRNIIFALYAVESIYHAAVNIF